MLRILKLCLLALLAGLMGGQQASAFSLLGAFNPDWQNTRLGYAGVNGQVGGPMNLGEEYRWNIPIVYYAVDGPFLDYFGERGREEIDKAMRVLNELPKASVIDLNSYPLKTERENYQAQALGLIDLKSFALATMMEEMGLASPSRFVFTLRNRWIGAPGFPTNYLVIKRNFDPVTFEPTSFINGDLWTYTDIIDDAGLTDSEVVNSRVDPLAYGNPVADLTASPFTSFTTGSYFTGLTRDDVGGLRYIYRTANKNVETAVTGAFGSVFGGGPIPSGGGQANGAVWMPFFISSNGVSQIPGGPGGAGSPWSPIVVSSNNAAGGGGGGTTPLGTNNFINAGLRSGVEKIDFVRVDYDNLLGAFIAPVLDSFSDTVYTNNTAVTQTLQRILTTPDIVFSAGDIYAGGDQGGPGFPLLARTTGWVNNRLLNNRLNAADSGPGTIDPGATGLRITFSNLGPLQGVNVFPPSLNEPTANLLISWGSFDGTTNAPVAYPSGTSIQDLERLALGVQ